MLNIWIIIISTFAVLPDNQSQATEDVKTFLSPMSLASLTSTSLSPYAESAIFNCPRLTAPRDLQIPRSDSTGDNVKVSYLDKLVIINQIVKLIPFNPFETPGTLNVPDICQQIFFVRFI